MKFHVEHLQALENLLVAVMPHQLYQGTSTTLALKIQDSFLITPDEFFADFNIMVWHKFEYYQRRHPDADNTLLYRALTSDNSRTRHLFSFDPTSNFDMGGGTSYEAMVAAIQFVCNLCGIEDKAEYYKDPYGLYVQNMNNNVVGDYIDGVALPTLIKALSVIDLVQEVRLAKLSYLDFELDFDVSRTDNLLSNLLYDHPVEDYITLHKNYFPTHIPSADVFEEMAQVSDESKLHSFWCYFDQLLPNIELMLNGVQEQRKSRVLTVLEKHRLENIIADNQASRYHVTKI